MYFRNDDRPIYDTQVSVMLGILGDIRVRTARVMGVVGVGFDNQHLGSLELQSIHVKTCLLSKPLEERPSRSGSRKSYVQRLKN